MMMSQKLLDLDAMHRFGELLEAWRERAGLNKSEAAQKMGVGVGTYTKWGRSCMPHRNFWMAIREVTGIDPAQYRRDLN